MKTLTELSGELRIHRRKLSLNQKDMLMKIGMSQQQYQRIEAGGDTRVSTLLRILEGVGLELMLVPNDRVQQIKTVLQSSKHGSDDRTSEKKNNDEADQSFWNSALRDLKDDP